MIYDLGIDVGTSYTAAAVRRPDGVVEVVGLGPIADNIPTVLYLGDDGTLIVGDAANRRSVIDPAGAAREFKRRMGDPTPMILRSSPFSAEALMARMIDYVTQRVADRERDLPRHTVVTHPANWGPYKLELFDQALRLAGAESATGLTEPQAAAIAYANEERVPTGSAVAVYDLGGGTFDAAVLRKTERGDARRRRLRAPGRVGRHRAPRRRRLRRGHPPPRAGAGRRRAGRPTPTTRPCPPRCSTFAGPAWRPRSSSPPRRRWRSRCSCRGSTRP